MSGSTVCGAPALATLYSSMWLCDDAGDVYVLKNLDSYVDGAVACLQYESCLNEKSKLKLEAVPAAPPPKPALEWLKVGSNFTNVVAGFEGIVCGLQQPSEAVIRLGVNATLPEGTSWSKIIGRAVKVAVGKDCVARMDDNGRLFVANVRQEYDLCNTKMKYLVLDHWKSIIPLSEGVPGMAGEPEPSINYKHLLLDHKDRLFVLTQSGEVYGCVEPCSEDSAVWVKVSSVPPINKKPGFLQNLFSISRFRGTDKEDVFNQVCVGKGSLWCLEAENCTLWHLVMSDFSTSTGVSELKTNWTSVKIPTEDERALLLSASKSIVDGIYTVMTKNSNGCKVIVAFSLNQADKGRVEIALPTCHDVKSLEILLNSDSLPASHLYPKLPHSDADVCCENGDCEFCRNASMLHIPSMPCSTAEEMGRGMGSLLGKRPHPDHQLEATSTAGEGSWYDTADTWQEHHPKRRHMEGPDDKTPFRLIDGIQIEINPRFKTDYPNVRMTEWFCVIKLLFNVL